MRPGAAALVVGALALAVIAIGVARTRDGSGDAGRLRVARVSLDERRPVALDVRRQQLAGIRTERVAVGTLSPKVRGVGVVAFDERRLFDVSLKLDGWIRDLYVSYTGQRIVKGQPLLSLYSQELIGAQLQYLAAMRGRDQLSETQKADRDYQERLIETPRRRLLNWDVPDDQIRALERAGEALDVMTFRSPADGVVIERSAVRGMHVEAGESLYTLADTTSVWVKAQFSPADAAKLKFGQSVEVSFGPRPVDVVAGRILHSYPSLTEPSKTASVQVEVPNPLGHLKAGMSATVAAAAESIRGLIVPADAVIDSGTRHTVFVATGEGRFEPRAVVVGARVDDRVVIEHGLDENEQVATGATFLLDSESQLQASLEGYAHAAVSTAAAPRGSDAALTLSIDPQPARVGDNQIRVQVRDVNGAPVTDASLAVRFDMAPMPSMNMPAMRTDVRMEHAGAGVYRGTATLPMAGSWGVTVSAVRSGRPLAAQHTSLVVR